MPDVIVNEGLTSADFKAGPGRFAWSMRPSDLAGFRGIPIVVTLRGGFKLYKLTGDKAKQSQWGVTPWWSAVNPYMQDTEGAKGRYEQAVLNGIDMSSMARYMSAVVINWNSLEEYVEVTIKQGVEINCFWGPFGTMQLSQANTPEGIASDLVLIEERSKTASAGFSAAALFDTIGVLDAYQFYIPGLLDAHLAGGDARICIDAHQMNRLAAHFGMAPPVPDIRRRARMPTAGEFLLATASGPPPARNEWLQRMDAALTRLEIVSPAARAFDARSAAVRPLLQEFVASGERYKLSAEPLKVKEKVGEYVLLAKTFL